MLRLTRRKLLDLDRVSSPEELNLCDPACVAPFVAYLVREMIAGEFAAMHVFYDESAECTRTCLWRPGDNEQAGWGEHVPVDGPCAMEMLRHLRGLSSRRQRHDSRISAVVHYRWHGSVTSMALESPHEWDVRLYVGEQRPDHLPYSLKFEH